MDDERPAVVAFDGSKESERALRAAAEIFRGRRLLVVSVWEPGFAAVVATPDATGLYAVGGYTLPDAGEIAALDHAHHDHAGSLAEAGAEIARGLGADAHALPVEDAEGVADTIAAVAEEHDAVAIAVGTRGLGALKSMMMGSTSHRLLHESRRPVLVVRADP